MSTIAQTFSALSGDFGTYLIRRRDRNLLLRQSDRTLADIRVSRELLELGVKAWPWQVASDQEAAPFRMNLEGVATAVKELEAYSDSDLSDLGISRGAIVESVLFGRPGIEQKQVEAAAESFAKAA